MYFLYFDPGLGAMLAQAAVAIAAAIALFSKTVMFKIKSILGLHKQEDEEPFDKIDIEENDIDNDRNNPTE